MARNFTSSIMPICTIVKKIISIIPVVLNPLFSTNTKDFSRNLKLTLPSGFAFILSISSSGGNKDLAIKISEFFRMLKGQI